MLANQSDGAKRDFTMTVTPKTLLLVDDDKPFLTRLGKAMEVRGFDVRLADTVAEGIAEVKKQPPMFAVVDLRLSDGNGLDVIAALPRWNFRLAAWVGTRRELRRLAAQKIWV